MDVVCKGGAGAQWRRERQGLSFKAQATASGMSAPCTITLCRLPIGSELASTGLMQTNAAKAAGPTRLANDAIKKIWHIPNPAFLVVYVSSQTTVSGPPFYAHLHQLMLCAEQCWRPAAQLFCTLLRSNGLWALVMNAPPHPAHKSEIAG